jgi:carbon-monoxide dehydrogenase medium subunit
LVAQTLGATMVAVGPNSRREIAAADFFTGPNQTALAADELLVAVRFPLDPPNPVLQRDQHGPSAGCADIG